MTEMNNEFKGLKGVSRRNILKAILYTPPVLMFGADSLFAAGEVAPIYKPKFVPKGKKIRVAQIGVYNRGGQVLDWMMSNKGRVELVAFSDLMFTEQDSKHAKYPDVPCFRDYREMFEKMHDKIDAVVIATPDHTHFPPVIHSMLLGKHVYVEKPLAQNVYECRLLEKAAKSCKGVVTQLGNQGHSEHGTKQFAKLVEEGIIKNVTKIDSWMTNSRRWHGWTIKDYPQQTPPAGYDWDLWLGRRQFRPYSDKMVGGNWRCWYEFGDGCMGDWGAHVLDAYHHYLKLGQPYEIETSTYGPSDLYFPQGSVIKFKFKARGDMPPLVLSWWDGKDNHPTPPSCFKKSNMGTVGSFMYSGDNIVLGRSHGADYQFLNNNELESKRKSGEIGEVKGPLSNHMTNFLNACQNIEPANSPFEVGAPLSEMLALGCIGQRFGGALKYDAKNMKITNHAEADKALKGPEVRNGWDNYDKFEIVTSKSSRIKSEAKARWEDLVDPTMSKWFNPYDWGNTTVKDGEVILTTDKSKWFLLTKKNYANFVFEAEIKMPVKEGNSGFLFRCQQAKNKAWGYQAEVDTADRKWSGGLYDEGRRMWFISPNRDKAESSEAAAKSIAEFRERAGECYKQGEWNKYRIVCVGQHIQIFVNGVMTTDVYDGMDLDGHIGIQHHGEKGLEYKFRNIRIKDLGVGGDIFYPHRENAKAPEVASKMEGDAYEAEKAKFGGGAAVESTNKGFQGAGYVDFAGSGSYVEFDNILAGETGEHTLHIRYAAANNRPCELFVNKEKVGRLNFNSTGDWTKWKTETVKVKFNKGGGNFVKIVAINNGPNIDAVSIVK